MLINVIINKEVNKYMIDWLIDWLTQKKNAEPTADLLNQNLWVWSLGIRFLHLSSGDSSLL